MSRRRLWRHRRPQRRSPCSRRRQGPCPCQWRWRLLHQRRRSCRNQRWSPWTRRPQRRQRKRPLCWSVTRQSLQTRRRPPRRSLCSPRRRCSCQRRRRRRPLHQRRRMCRKLRRSPSSRRPPLQHCWRPTCWSLSRRRLRRRQRALCQVPRSRRRRHPCPCQPKRTPFHRGHTSFRRPQQSQWSRRLLLRQYRRPSSWSMCRRW
mmetsp:Transcript_157882/g.483813  ORF Transcript_157882/g.483813 Transcript_157882/m.483813 type:complete len:204 (-) Transcript_157882:207-818(-)